VSVVPVARILDRGGVCGERHVASALEEAYEHALPGRTAVAVNEVWRCPHELLLNHEIP
jgi:hypothetical protein